MVFAGQYVGVTEVDNDIWLVSFMDYDLGFFDKDVNRVEPVGENPFTPKVLPMSPEWALRYLVSRVGFEPTTLCLKVLPKLLKLHNLRVFSLGNAA